MEKNSHRVNPKKTKQPQDLPPLGSSALRTEQVGLRNTGYCGDKQDGAQVREIVLDAGDTRVSIEVGETVYLNTSTGFGAMMRPSNPGWDEVFTTQGSSFLIASYITQNTTPPGLCGGARFQHRFTGVKPGVAVFTNTRANRLFVTVSGPTPPSESTGDTNLDAMLRDVSRVEVEIQGAKRDKSRSASRSPSPGAPAARAWGESLPGEMYIQVEGPGDS